MLVTFLLFSSLSLIAQKTITGKVINKVTGQPIASAAVQIKGSKTGALTNPEGLFSIKVPNQNSVLVFSFVGYEPVEMAAPSGSEMITVRLSEMNSALDAVLVTGYTSQRKKDITGSVAVVNVSNMKSIPSGTAEAALQGQASGVTVINSGQPGGGSNLRIRGITSPGNTTPLVIIDGVQGSLHDLNANDIESIQVLKDAGAAAIYGVQGANGVIIVTTKKGKPGKSKITYDAYVGTQQPLSKGFNLANTMEYATAIRQMEINSGVPAGSRNQQFGQGDVPTIPDYITPTAAKAGDPGTDPSAYNINSNQITKANKAGTDWFHEIFKPAIIQSHTVTASGGGDKSSYLFSVGYLDQEGTLINSYLKRYTARLNTTFNVKDHIRIGENAYVVYKQNPQITNQNEGNAISMSYREPPIIPVHDIMGNYAGTKSAYLSNSQNPVANMERTANNRGNDWQVNGNVFAEVDFLKHFTARTSFGGSFDNYYYYYFNYTAYENAEGNTNPNSFTEGGGYNSLWLWTNTVNYSNVFGKHSVKALIGSEAKNVYQRGIAAGRSNYYSTNPNYWILNTGDPGTQSNSGGTPYQLAISSLFGRLDYSYDDKYLFAFTLRRDGASVFADGHQYGTFPSLTAGWRISNENFMKNITWINQLKLRGGWGKLGSLNNINPTNSYTLYASGAGLSYYPITGSSNSSAQGFFNNQLGNTSTTWESDIITNIGIDATIFKDKLDLSIEWYKKAISGLLFQKVSAIGNFNGGANQPFINLGDVQNTGIDIAATYHATIKRDFKLDLTGTFTSYNNKVMSLPTGYKYIDEYSAGSSRIGAFSRLQPGQAIGAFYGYKVLGLFRDASDVAKSPTQDGAAPGRFKYADMNGDGKISDADRTFIGNPNPKFSYGLNIAASYKNFDFSMFLYGVAGNDVVNYVKYWTDFPQVFGGNVSKNAVYNSWTPNNPNATVPILEKSANFSNTTVFNSYYIEKGSYLRCKSLILGYTIPAANLRKAGIDRLRVYLQVANLFTITKYTGLDPELQGSDLNNNSNFGIDFGNYPANQKNFNIGVNVGF
ncbi:MAG: TonB-dependent receptor [Bacteroidota bacterium]|nr:TonB-dependent receptor [Bacteroidota bacterium]